MTGQALVIDGGVVVESNGYFSCLSYNDRYTSVDADIVLNGGGLAIIAADDLNDAAQKVVAAAA